MKSIVPPQVEESRSTANHPVILDGLLQPHFPFARVFTLFFLDDCLVFTKTGSFGTNAAGTMRSALGGFTADAMVAGAIGSLVDLHNDQERRSRSAEIAPYTPEAMVAAHKNNFRLSFDSVKTVEIRGPNFAGELRIIILAERKYKFRIDRQSKASAKYVEEVFLKFLPSKTVRS